MPSADAAEVLSRDFIFHINTGTTALPVLTEIGGVESHAPGRSKNNSDTTKYSNHGEKSHLPASIERTLKLSAKYLEDASDGTRDAGQEACETLSDAFGPAGIKQFQVTTPGAITKIALGSCDAGETGGSDPDSIEGWECNITFVEKPA